MNFLIEKLHIMDSIKAHTLLLKANKSESMISS